MKQMFLVLAILVAQLGLTVPPAVAAPPHPGAAPRINPKGKNGVMYLMQKTPVSGIPDPNDWVPDDTGAWGKLRYSRSGPNMEYVFTGYDLEPGTPYALVWKYTAWFNEATGYDYRAYSFGLGSADAKGELTIKSSGEGNFDCSPTSAWLWLVPCTNPWYSCWAWPMNLGGLDFDGSMVPRPLFAYLGIAFDDTDAAQEACPLDG